MEQETIAQTMLDQLVTDENSQMLKALIPYLSFSGQRILAAYAKTQELCNTLQLFSRPQNDMQICSSRPMNPMELLNDIRKFSELWRKQKKAGPGSKYVCDARDVDDNK